MTVETPSTASQTTRARLLLPLREACPALVSVGSGVRPQATGSPSRWGMGRTSPMSTSLRPGGPLRSCSRPAPSCKLQQLGKLTGLLSVRYRTYPVVLNSA